MDALGGGADACAGDDDHLRRRVFPQDSTGCPVAKMRTSLKFIVTRIKTVIKLAILSSRPGGMLFSNVLEYSI